ncbi:hypothetical protein LINGRAHAP2_LOCUS24248 [Linum grandiflorum]
MRWYLDEDGFPKRGLTTKSEMDSLLKNLESIKDWTSSEAEDFDDVFDETLLPLPIQRSSEIKQSQENYATDQTKPNPMSESNEDFQGETKLLDTPVIHYYRLLCSPGPQTIPPQMFDMTPSPQGIVIREPTDIVNNLDDEEDFLDNSSPDTVLFKTPDTVMQELSGNHVSLDELMAEQCAIEADLIAQKLKDAAHTLAQASLAVPEELKIGPSQPMNTVSEETTCPLGSEQDSKPRSRKRQSAARKEDSSKKQVTDAKKVEAASLKWLPKEK